MLVGRGSAARDVSWATLSPVSQEVHEVLAVLDLQLGVVFCWAPGFLPVQSP